MIPLLYSPLSADPLLFPFVFVDYSIYVLLSVAVICGIFWIVYVFWCTIYVFNLWTAIAAVHGIVVC